MDEPKVVKILILMITWFNIFGSSYVCWSISLQLEPSLQACKNNIYRTIFILFVVVVCSETIRIESRIASSENEANLTIND